jgi:hypothetical protein
LRARVERMLANDDDVRRLNAALNALTALRPANRAFAQDRLIALAFSPLLTTKYGSLVATLKTQLNSRAARVPNERLNRYLSGFRFGHFVSKEQKAALVELVRERLRRKRRPAPMRT